MRGIKRGGKNTKDMSAVKKEDTKGDEDKLPKPPG